MKIALTFDIDWATDMVIRDTVDLLKQYNVKSTFFLTHVSSYIESLFDDERFCFGVHPNFRDKNPDEALETVNAIRSKLPCKIAPWRSHGLCVSSNVNRLMANRNYLISSNDMREYENALTPQKKVYNMVELPIYFMDYFYLESGGVRNILRNSKGLKIFDFHPIWVYLNASRLLETIKNKGFTTYTLSELVY